MKTVFLALLSLTAIFFFASSLHADPPPTFKLDPVELCNGKEVAGDEAIFVDHEGYRYRFSSVENKQTFEADAAQYRIQMSGGCGKMGSLSGVGSVDRFAVHDRKIYLFASDGCRAGFLREPERFLEVDDTPGHRDNAHAHIEHKLLAKVVEGMGGADAIDNTGHWHAAATWNETLGETVWNRRQSYRIAFPDRYRNETGWVSDDTNSISVNILNGEQSAFEYNGQSRPMYSDARRELTRNMNRHLLVILKARNRSDFNSMRSNERSTIDGKSYDTLRIGFDGTVADLLIADDGTIAAIEFRGRTPQGYQTIQRRFLDYKALDGGLKLPTRQIDHIAGQTEVYREVTFDTVTVNDTIDDSLFGGK